MQGDITRVQVEAMVNAANNRVGNGGRVNGAIQPAAGPALLADCINRFTDDLATCDAGWTIGGDDALGHALAEATIGSFTTE